MLKQQSSKTVVTKWPTNHDKISRLYVASFRVHSEKMDSRAGQSAGHAVLRVPGTVNKSQKKTDR